MGESDEIGSVSRLRRVDRVGKGGSFPWLAEILVATAGSCSGVDGGERGWGFGCWTGESTWFWYGILAIWPIWVWIVLWNLGLRCDLITDHLCFTNELARCVVVDDPVLNPLVGDCFVPPFWFGDAIRFRSIDGCSFSSYSV